VSKYAEPWAATLSGLKQRLEAEMEKVFEVYIRTTPERLWEAITSTEARQKYSFGMQWRSDWTEGSRFEITEPEGNGTWGEGQNVELDPPRRLVQTMNARWSEAIQEEPESRMTWEIEPQGELCRLTVTHDQLREDANDQLYGGWPMILSSLKSLLETGESLDIQISPEGRERLEAGV
jgi:uncharacterized protein YndB with AHSA1/START domain